MWNASEPATLETWQSTADMFVQECGVLEGCDSICAETYQCTKIALLPGKSPGMSHVATADVPEL